MQRDMREVGAAYRRRNRLRRTIAAFPPRKHLTRAFLSLRGVKMTDDRNKARRDRGNALYASTNAFYASIKSLVINKVIK